MATVVNIFLNRLYSTSPEEIVKNWPWNVLGGGWWLGVVRGEEEKRQGGESQFRVHWYGIGSRMTRGRL